MSDLICLIISGLTIVFFMAIAYYDGFIRMGLIVILGIIVIGWAFSNLRLK